MLFFSATYDKEVMDFARLIVTEPTIIRYYLFFSGNLIYKRYTEKVKISQSECTKIIYLYYPTKSIRVAAMRYRAKTPAWLITCNRLKLNKEYKYILIKEIK